MSKKTTEERVCGNCTAPDGQDDTRLKPCSRCRLVFYCNKACQTQHWKASHRADCVALADRSPDAVSRAEETPLSAMDSLTIVTCSICLAAISRATNSTLPCEHSFHESCLAANKALKCVLCMKPFRSVEQIFAAKEPMDTMMSMIQDIELSDADHASGHADIIARIEQYGSDLVDAVNLGCLEAAIEFVKVFEKSSMKALTIEGVAFRVFERDTTFKLTKQAFQFLYRQLLNTEIDILFYRNWIKRLVVHLSAEDFENLTDDFLLDDSDVATVCRRDLLEVAVSTKTNLSDRYLILHANALHAYAVMLSDRDDEPSEVRKSYSLAADRFEFCLKRLPLSHGMRIDLLEGLCLSLLSSNQQKRAKPFAKKLLQLDPTNEIAISTH